MVFRHKTFSCYAEKYALDSNSFIIKFFDLKKEHDAADIKDYVLVDPGYGYLCLKYKGEDALLSGFLEETIFNSEEIIAAAIDFVESLSPISSNAYIPHNIMKVSFTGSVEYNGEY